MHMSVCACIVCMCMYVCICKSIHTDTCNTFNTYNTCRYIQIHTHADETCAYIPHTCIIHAIHTDTYTYGWLWKSLGKSLGDCDVAVKVPEKVPETFSGTFRSPQYILRYTELYWVILISAEYISVYTTGPPHQAFYFVTVSVLWHNSVYLEYIFLAHFPCYATTAVIPSMAQLYSVILSSPGGQLSRGNSVNWAMLCVSSSCTLMTVFFRVLPRFPWKADHLDISV